MAIIEKTGHKSTTSSYKTRKKKAAVTESFASIAKKTVGQRQQLSSHDVITIVDENGEIDYDLVNELKDNIHQKGEELLNQPSYDRVLEYKKVVEKFLRAIAPHLHDKQQLNSVKRSGESYEERKFTLVARINESLNETVNIVLQTQIDQLLLLASLEKIKGLVIDLLH